MSAYIICGRRKAKPRIAIEVCKGCRFRKKCRDLWLYRNPSLFPALE